MCGRFALYSSLEKIQQELSLVKYPLLKPRYNIAPNQPMPVLREPENLELLYWGINFSWFNKDSNFVQIKIETCQKKKFLQNLLKYQRAIVLADGFYKWKLIKQKKQAFYCYHKQHKLLALAALYHQDNCALLTQPATQDFNLLSSNIPVILSTQDINTWLSHKKLDIADFLLNKTITSLQYYPVSCRVNNVGYDELNCIHSLS